MNKIFEKTFFFSLFLCYIKYKTINTLMADVYTNVIVFTFQCISNNYMRNKTIQNKTTVKSVLKGTSL